MASENRAQGNYGGEGSARERRGPAPYRDPVLLLTMAGAFALDQFSKYLVATNMYLGQSWPREGLFRITYGLNTGTIFGLFPGQTLILTAASIVAISFLVYFYRTHATPSPLLRLAVGLQLGGALGNLLDRLRIGAVVDFLDVGWWPIFNLADSSIMVGITILAWYILFGPEEGGGGEGDDGGAVTDADR